LDVVNAREQAYWGAVEARETAEKELEAAKADSKTQQIRLNELVVALNKAKTNEQAAGRVECGA